MSGDLLPIPELDAAGLPALLGRAHARAESFAATPIGDILTVLDRLSRSWQPGTVNWRRALALVEQELAFSRPMLEMSLAVVPELLSYRQTSARLAAELGGSDQLDGFVASQSFAGRVRALPLGVLLHVTAGNVFLGAIDSLLMGFLTKNISIVKVSSRNLAFPTLFADSLRQVDRDGVLAGAFELVHFASGDRAVESGLKAGVDGIVAWGGEEMVQSYKQDLPPGVKLLEHGPKISFQVAFRIALAEIGYAAAGQLIAADVSPWDQAACASPQNLFVERGTDIEALLDATAAALARAPWPRGRLSDDEHVEILKERARADYNTVMGGGICRSGDDFLLHLDPAPGLRPSPLNRTLIVKEFADLADLARQVRPLSRNLQSCGYLAADGERDALLRVLGGAGVSRFTRLGCMMRAPIGAPHDGRRGLLELVRLVPDEQDESVLGFVNDAVAHIPLYKRLAGDKTVAALEALPTISGADLVAGDWDALARLSRRDASGGYVFASGGTTGAPKYSLYGTDEFDAVGRLLARGFAAQGIQAGDVVANLFVAGNMWSSFLAVDRALTALGARTLPIGGTTDRDSVLGYLERFRPRAAVGLPTQIVELARRAHELERSITLDIILYAGEHLSIMARRYLEQVFGCRRFGSAGYASVDAGPIGYQCRSCDGGVHHLFSDQVHLEVIDGEAVVTSLIKRQMPVIRLRTGDLVDWVEGSCACGSDERRFRLLGRADSQFNVWSCRLFVEDIERTLADLGVSGALFQILVRQDSGASDRVIIRLELAESGAPSPAAVADGLYRQSADLRSTHARSWLDSRLSLEILPPGGIPRVPRTGKIRSLVDER